MLKVLHAREREHRYGEWTSVWVSHPRHPRGGKLLQQLRRNNQVRAVVPEAVNQAPAECLVPVIEHDPIWIRDQRVVSILDDLDGGAGKGNDVAVVDEILAPPPLVVRPALKGGQADKRP